MKISSINAYSISSSYLAAKNVKKTSNVSFEGKHDCAKALGGIFGTLAAVGAVGGSIIMSGGIVLPALLATYTATAAAGGAYIGHQMDKDAAKREEEEAKIAEANKKNK